MKICKPYRECQQWHLTQGFKPDHLANDWGYKYGTFLVAPFNAKVLSIVGADKIGTDTSYLRGGYGIRIQSIEDPTLSMVYWHTLPVFPISVGDIVLIGQPICQMGNSGFVLSAEGYVEVNIRTLPPYPGTHTHVTIGHNNSDGTYTPLDFSKLIDWSIPIKYDLLTSIMSVLNRIAYLFKK